MAPNPKSLVDQLFDEVDLAQKHGLVTTYTITNNQLKIELAPHLHYSKTYELFAYLKEKYNFNVFVSDTRIIVAYYK